MNSVGFPRNVQAIAGLPNGFSQVWYLFFNLLYQRSSAIVPTGQVIDYAGAAAPNGFLLCNGAAVSRTTYAALFAVIGTTYGAGDGSTTFNVPNVSGTFLKAIKT